jgi:hypothetical protein
MPGGAYRQADGREGLGHVMTVQRLAGGRQADCLRRAVRLQIV